MTTIPHFWFYIALLIAVLIVLFIAECVRAFRVDSTDFDRGRRKFNAGILLVIVLAMSYGAYALEMHRQHLLSLITPYPGARYAPERESLSERERWVYVTQDKADNIVDFYKYDATIAKYELVVDQQATTSRLLFSRNDNQLFLTITREGDKHVLYYSEKGDRLLIAR